MEEIARWSRRTPDEVAIRFGDEEVDYLGLERRVARLADARRRRASIGAGDRVAYLGRNAPLVLEALFACARPGAIFVPGSARLPAPELAVRLTNTTPTALLVEAPFAQTAGEAAAAPDVRVVPFGDGDGDDRLGALLDGARYPPTRGAGWTRRCSSSTRRGPRDPQRPPCSPTARCASTR